MLNKSWDLIAIALILVGVSALATTRIFPLGLAWLGIAVIVLIPGYVWSVVLLPHLDFAERLLYSIGLSLAADILGGLVLNATPWGLEQRSWIAWVDVFTLIGGGVVWLKRARQATAQTASPIRFDLNLVLGFSGAVIIGIVAILTAEYSVNQHTTPFTQLWAVPSEKTDTCNLQIGISNQENKLTSYELYVSSQGIKIEHWQNIDLESAREWVTQVALPCPTHPVNVELYRADHSDELYRSVSLAPIAFAPSQSEK